MSSANARAQKPPIEGVRWARIKLFAMDVDGILTDGTVAISSDGTETKSFSVLDGLGLARVRDGGIILAWISGRKSGATKRRAEELRIPHLIQGRTDKVTALGELMASLNVPPDEVCYMGDDVIDVSAMEAVGIGISVPTGMPVATAAADYVTQRTPGQGAVREICDLILEARNNQTAVG